MDVKDDWLRRPTYTDGTHTMAIWNETRNYVGNQLHSVADAPAVVTSAGEQKWYKNGALDRDGDRPAVITPKGSKMWFKGGRAHRARGPAVVRSNGEIKYYVNSRLHRDFGPAVKKANGSQYWYRRGLLQYGLRADGTQEYFTNGVRDRANNMPAIVGPTIMKWFRAGVLHRDDGPAVVEPNGYREWWFHGVQYDRYAGVARVNVWITAYMEILSNFINVSNSNPNYFIRYPILNIVRQYIVQE
jgi:hypothetical protein